METTFCVRDRLFDLLATAFTADKTTELDSIYKEEEKGKEIMHLMALHYKDDIC